MSTQQISSILNKITDGVSLSDSQKSQLENMYLLTYYKYVFEILLLNKSQDLKFHKRFMQFIDEELQTVHIDEKKMLTEILSKAPQKAVADVVAAFSDSLPDEDKEKITKNLDDVTTDNQEIKTPSELPVARQNSYLDKLQQLSKPAAQS
ncbi:MAG: hypothetical protein ABIO02_00615 [Patescibacteria group bacterium]